jgi:hypothetical protein
MDTVVKGETFMRTSLQAVSGAFALTFAVIFESLPGLGSAEREIRGTWIERGSVIVTLLATSCEILHIELKDRLL